MKGKTHLIAGAGAGLSAFILLADKPVIAAATGVATLLGSIAPDIDNRKSMLGSKMKITSTVTNKIFGHRGITHTPLLLIVFFLIITGCLLKTNTMEFFPILCGFSVGCITHLFLDMFTKGGVPLLFPFTKKRINLTPFKTGGIFEILFGLIIAVFSIGVAIVTLLIKLHAN